MRIDWPERNTCLVPGDSELRGTTLIHLVSTQLTDAAISIIKILHDARRQKIENLLMI
jgi:hypothetical protein